MKVNEKHAIFLRVVHWLNVPLLALMIWSGILIYWANDVYPGFFPEWFYRVFDIEGRLAEGLWVHFFVAWFFVLNGLAYVIWLFASGHWRELFPCRRTDPLLPAKFNAVQRLAYMGAIGLGLVAVLTGLAIYKPVQLSWLAALFGGYPAARLIHFLVMLALSAFAVVHVVQVARAGWNNFRAMVAGFEVDDEP